MVPKGIPLLLIPEVEDRRSGPNLLLWTPLYKGKISGLGLFEGVSLPNLPSLYKRNEEDRWPNQENPRASYLRA